MAETAVLDQAFCLGEGVLQIRSPVHRQYRGEFLVGKLLAQIHRVDLADQDLASFRNGHARQRRDGRSRLSDDLRVQRAVDKNRLADLVQLVLLQEVAASRRKLTPYRIIHVRMDNDGLLRGADHAVVEGLGVDDGIDSQQDVCGLVDNGRRVSRADTQCRGTGGVCRVDHARSAGGENDVRLLHQQSRHVTGGHVDPADDVFGSAGSHRSFEDDLCRLHRAGFRPVMRADDNAVAGLQRQKRLEDSRRGRVRGRDNGTDQSERLCDLPHAVFLVFFNHTAGFGVPIGIVDVFGSKVILDHLVLHDPHSCLGHSGLGQGNARLVGRGRSREENAVHLFL